MMDVLALFLLPAFSICQTIIPEMYVSQRHLTQYRENSTKSVLNEIKLSWFKVVHLVLLVLS